MNTVRHYEVLRIAKTWKSRCMYHKRYRTNRRLTAFWLINDISFELLWGLLGPTLSVWLIRTRQAQFCGNWRISIYTKHVRNRPGASRNISNRKIVLTHSACLKYHIASHCHTEYFNLVHTVPYTQQSTLGYWLTEKKLHWEQHQ